MGKRIITQRRGKGTPTYRAPSFRYKGAVKHKPYSNKNTQGEIDDIIHCRGHSAPLVNVKYEDGEKRLLIAPEGIKSGGMIVSGINTDIEIGNTTRIGDVPEGTLIYNIEAVPGDGGKFARASGVFARVVAITPSRVIVQLPSKKQKSFNPECRASIGIVAGGGRTEKPLLRAGTSYYKMRAKNKLWPKVSGASMNAVDHPFGCTRSLRKSKSRPISKNAPPGRKVGMVGARRTGRRKK